MRLDVQALVELVLVSDGGMKEGVSRRVSSYFASIGEFLSCTKEQLTGLRSASGKPVQLSDSDIMKIIEISRSGVVSGDLTLVDNYIRTMARDFARRQVENIGALALERLNINPLLVRSLNLRTPLELLEFNVNAAVSRSIVTSMGYFVQRLLETTSDEVENVRAGWDLVKRGKDGTNHWIQVKSGPNDMDKDQILYWLEKIKEVERAGDRGYIGITYGRRDSPAVSLSLMRTYLPDMEVRTLVGKELWDFLSDDSNFHSRLFDDLRAAALAILGNKSIQEEINGKVHELLAVFEQRYGSGEEGVSNYINSIF